MRTFHNVSVDLLALPGKAEEAPSIENPLSFFYLFFFLVCISQNVSVDLLALLSKAEEAPSIENPLSSLRSLCANTSIH